MPKIIKHKNFLIALFTVFYTTSTLFWAFAATSPWTQTNWVGGDGQANWSDATMYSTSSDIVDSTTGQITLAVNEELSNTGFESDLTGWTSSTQTLTSQPDATAGSDVHLQQGQATRNYGVATAMGSGSLITASTARKAILSFDVTSIPASATVTAATLTLVCSAETNTTDRSVGVHRALTQWFEGLQDNGLPGGGENASTWNLRNNNGSVAWAGGAGGGSGSDFTASATATTSITSTGTFNWNVLADVSAWVAGSATNYGWWVVNADEATAGSLKSFATSDNATAGNRPQLVVNYTFGTRDTVTTYNSTVGSAQLIPGTNGTGTFTQSINVGDTNTYNLSAYAYTDGSAVTSSDLSLYYNSSTVATTFTSVGDGWYQLTGTVTGVASAVGAGVQVASGETVYVDNFSLSRYASSGSLTASIFDTEQSSNWGALTYNVTTPTDTTVTVKARTSNSSDMSGATAFASCDAITSSADISSNNCVTDGHRYIQYQVNLATADTLETPIFQDISIVFTSGGGGDVMPPSISLTPLSPDPTDDNTPTLSGTATDSAGTITAVQFQVDSTVGSWSNCTTDDGTYDEATETFYCTTSTLADGSHTVYVRATDNSSNTTANEDAASDTFTVDTDGDAGDSTVPTTINLDSPDGNFYTKDDRPTFKWEKTTDNVALSKYIFHIDNGDLGDFTIDAIPVSQTAPYENSQYKIKYSDTELALTTKSSLNWGSSTNNGKLKEGKRTWTVTAVDTSDNQASTSRTLFVDKTSPDVEFTKVNDANYSASQVKIVTTDITPTLSGKISDKLAGDKTDNKVASGPDQIKITIEESTGFSYTPVSEYVLNINTPLYECTNLKVPNNNKENKCNKFTTFDYTLKDPLPFGIYKVSLIGSDKVGNISSQVSFMLEVGAYGTVATPQQIMETQNSDEKPDITYEVKPRDVPQFATTSVFTKIASTFRAGINAFGNDYQKLRTATPASLALNPKMTALREIISNSAFNLGEKSAHVSNKLSTTIVKLGYLFATEPTQITNVQATILNGTSVKISWETNHPATGKVNYGYTSGIYAFEMQTDMRSTYHEFILENLAPGTNYHYEVMSQNERYVYDANREFQTPIN